MSDGRRASSTRVVHFPPLPRHFIFRYFLRYFAKVSPVSQLFIAPPVRYGETEICNHVSSFSINILCVSNNYKTTDGKIAFFHDCEGRLVMLYDMYQCFVSIATHRMNHYSMLCVLTFTKRAANDVSIFRFRTNPIINSSLICTFWSNTNNIIINWPTCLNTHKRYHKHYIVHHDELDNNNTVWAPN